MSYQTPGNDLNIVVVVGVRLLAATLQNIRERVNFATISGIGHTLPLNPGPTTKLTLYETRRGVDSGPFLPPRRIAAGMKAGNHDQGVIFDDKKQRAREATQEGAANIITYGGKLPGIIAHPFDQGVNPVAKASA